TGSITLGGNNNFRGPVSVTVGGANPATVNNVSFPLTLGAVTTGTGLFTATGTNQNVVQDPNSVLSLGGPSLFTATAASSGLCAIERHHPTAAPRPPSACRCASRDRLARAAAGRQTAGPYRRTRSTPDPVRYRACRRASGLRRRCDSC